MKITDVEAIALVRPALDRDPIWEELFTVRPEIVAGKITLNDRPGWGIELDERTLERRGAWA